MSNSNRYKNPNLLIADLGIETPEEINVNAIAQFCGATVRYKKLIGYEGRIIGTNESAIITVNSNSTPGRQRFSVAHELGHWFFDRGKMFQCSEEMFNQSWEDYKKNGNVEIRANRYAADLLMPEHIFNPIVANQPITFDTVEKVSEEFETSLTATAIRVVESGSMPGMVLCCENGKRLWFKRGPSVSEFLWPIKKLHKKTNAFQISKGGSSVAFKEETYADYWITHPNSKDYDIHADTREIGKGLTLTLLWWKDEQQLIDLEDAPDAYLEELEDPHF